MSFDRESQPHRRYDPLSGRWVLVSPQRTQRPWQGQSEAVPPAARPAHDPDCYLCPGNRRAGGAVNPPYAGTFVFDNDFAALSPAAVPEETPSGALTELGSAQRSRRGRSKEPFEGSFLIDPLFRAEPTQGVCRVVCFSPRHDLTLGDLEPPDLRRVIDTWASETEALGKTYRWVQVFENKGAMMGCSNPHPHGQIWAGSALPSDAAAEDRNQREWHQRTGSPLLVDYAERETRLSSRLVCDNDEFLAVVPFWAVWPFETLLLPRRRTTRLGELDGRQRDALAALLRRLLRAYDALFDVSMPYCMGWHGAPFDAGPHEHWQLHAHIYPPLLRSATVKKFMVGYEMLAEPQRDLTPELAAARLRALAAPL